MSSRILPIFLSPLVFCAGANSARAEDIPLVVEKAVVVTFPSQRNQTYKLLGSPDPGPAQWQSLQDGIQGTGGKVTIFYKSESEQKLFYKVESSLSAQAQRSLLSLAHLDLSNADLTGYQLPGEDLAGWIFRSARFDNANLAGASFNGAGLQNASFKGADLSHVDFTGAGLGEANFYGANLTGDSFVNGNMLGTDFRNANLTGVSFDHTSLTGANFAGQNLANHAFRGCFMNGADLSGCNLSGADLRQTSLSGAPYSGSATPANLTGATITGANFEGSQLSPVNLSGRDLRSVFLRGASIFGADWSGVNAAGSDLTMLGVDSGTKLNNANFSDCAMDGLQASFQFIPQPPGASFARANFRNASLKGASLPGCVFINADLTGANFAFANLGGANLTGATGFNADQPGTFFGDGAKNPDGSFRPLSSTILPDGTKKIGRNPGVSPGPSSVPPKLHLSLSENGVTTETDVSFSQGKFSLGTAGPVQGSFLYEAGQVAKLGLLYDSRPADYLTLLYLSPAGGKVFRNYQGNGDIGVTLIGTFSLP